MCNLFEFNLCHLLHFILKFILILYVLFNCSANRIKIKVLKIFLNIFLNICINYVILNNYIYKIIILMTKSKEN